MTTKEVLGHIPCPSCGEAMRVTNDKNGNPFGYCDHGCGQQLRVGPDKFRVQKFRERYQWAKPKAEPAAQAAHPVPVTVPAKPAAQVPQAKAAEPVPAPAPTKPAASPFDFLLGRA